MGRGLRGGRRRGRILAALAAVAWLAPAPAGANEIMRTFTDAQVLDAVRLETPGSCTSDDPCDSGALRHPAAPTGDGVYGVVRFADNADSETVGAIGILGPHLPMEHFGGDGHQVWTGTGWERPGNPPVSLVGTNGALIASIAYSAWGHTGEMAIWIPLATDEWAVDDEIYRAIWLTQADGRTPEVRYSVVNDTTTPPLLPAFWTRLDWIARTVGLTGDDDFRIWDPKGAVLPFVLLENRPPVPRSLDLADTLAGEQLRRSPATVLADGRVRIPMLSEKPLDAARPPPASAFAVALGYGAGIEPTNVEVVAESVGGIWNGGGVAAGAVLLTVSPPVGRDQAVRGRYADPSGSDDALAVQDTDGTDAPSFRFAVERGPNQNSEVPPVLLGNDNVSAAPAGADARATHEGRMQTFTTGGNAGGWRPTRVSVFVTSIDADADDDVLTAAIYATDDDGDPPDVNRAEALAELGRARANTLGKKTFDIPAGTGLQSETTYALHVAAAAGNPKLSTTTSDDETASFRGWTVGDEYLWWRTHKTGNGEWADGDRPLRMTLEGDGNGPPRGRIAIAGDDPPAGGEDRATQSTAWTGVELTATAVDVGDPDGAPPGGFVFGWSWRNAAGDELEDVVGNRDRFFIPDGTQVGQVIRAHASFTDAEGNRESLSSRPLLVKDASTNLAPAFAAGLATEAAVSEHAPGGTDVGPVIWAADTLHEVGYRVEFTGIQANKQAALESFELVPGEPVEYLDRLRASVRFRTKAGHPLDHEYPVANEFPVTVEAYDGFGGFAEHRMTIRVTDGPNVDVSADPNPVASSDRRARFAASGGGAVPAGTRIEFEADVPGAEVAERRIDLVRNASGAAEPWSWEPAELRFEPEAVSEVATRRARLRWLNNARPGTYDVVDAVERNDLRDADLVFDVVHVPPPTVSPARDALTVREGDRRGTADVRLTLRTAAGSPRPAAPYSVIVRSRDGPDEGGAETGSDYTAYSSNVGFAPGDFEEVPGGGAWTASRTVSVAILDDGFDEGGDETFRVEFSPAQSSVGLFATVDAAGAPCDPCAVEVTIEDDDRAELEEVSVVDDRVVLRFSRPLDEDRVPAPRAFTVRVNGAEVAVEAVTVSGGRLTLRLASTPPPSSRVEVAYGPGDPDDPADADNPPLLSDNGVRAGHPAVFPEDGARTYVAERMEIATEADHVDLLEELHGDEDDAARKRRLGEMLEHARAGTTVRRHEGRLRVKLRHRYEAVARWGSVCRDRFAEQSEDGEPNQAAATACRAMGYRTGRWIPGYYPAGFLEALTEADERIWLDDVRCWPGARGRGKDEPITSLAEHCWHAGLGLHNCDHSTDVFVRCEGGLRLLSARVAADDAHEVVLTFGDDVDDTGGDPARSAFAVNVGAGWETPAALAVDGARVRLTTAAEIAAGTRVRVRYEPLAGADATLLRGFGGVDAEAFCAAFDAPGDGAFGRCEGMALVDAAVDGAALTLTFDEALEAAPAATLEAFVDGAWRSFEDADVSLLGRTVTLTLAGAVDDGTEIAVRHRPADGAAVAGREAAAAFCIVFAAPGGDGAFAPCPALAVERVSTVRGGVQWDLEVGFNVPPDTAHLPPDAAFTVDTGAGTEKLALDGVSFNSAGALVVQLTPVGVHFGATVRLSYAVPTGGADALQTVHGFAAPSFCLEFPAEVRVNNVRTDVEWHFCGGPRPASVRGDPDDDDALTVAFDRDLDASNLPPADAFEVLVEGAAAPAVATAVAAAPGDARAVRLSFENVRGPFGRPAQVAYADPTLGDDAHAVQAAEGGGDAKSFCLGFRWPEQDDDGSWGECAPLLRAAAGSEGATAADRDRVALTFDRPLASEGAPAEAFRVEADGVWVPVSGVEHDHADGVVRLTLRHGADVADGAALRVTYRDPTDADDAAAVQGADAGSLCIEFAWPGGGAYGRCPTLVSWSVRIAGRESRVELAFDAALDAVNAAPLGRFGYRFFETRERSRDILVGRTYLGGGKVRVAGYAFSSGRVRLTYDDPTPGDDADVLQSGGGVDAPSFCLEGDWPNLRPCADGGPGGRYAPAPVAVRVTGTPRVAGRLDADTSVLAAAFGLADGASFEHRWIRVDADGESNPTRLARAGTLGWYHPEEGDRGKRIKVEVAYTDAGGDTWTFESAPTDAVAGCADNAILLGGADSTGQHEGDVQICTGGAMRPICDDGWNEAGAGVACRQLGYAGGTATYASAFGLLGSANYAIRRIECAGAESALHRCPHEAQESQTACHFSERAGARCEAAAAGELVTAAFGFVQHDGSAPFTVRIQLSAPLGGDADLRSLLTVDGGTLGTAALVDGRDDLWEVTVTPDAGADFVTVRLAGSAACGEAAAVCTVDGRRVAAAETVVGRELTAAFDGAPVAHEGKGDEVVLRLRFSAPLAPSTANVANHVTATNQDALTVTREAYDRWRVRVLPSGDDPVTLRLAPSPPCLASGARCAADGRRAAGASITVPARMKAEFTDVPDAHGGDGTTFKVRLRFSPPLHGDTLLETDLRPALTATNQSSLVLGWGLENGEEFVELTVAPDSDDAVEIALAASPACDQPGALCSADGRPASAAETVVAGVPVGAAFEDVPKSHDGATGFELRLELSAPLDADAADVADNLTAENGTVGTVYSVDSRSFGVPVTPAGSGNVTVRLAASPPCDRSGAMCTAGGRRAGAAEATVLGQVTARFKRVPGGHSGSTGFRMLLELSEPLDPDTAAVADHLTATNADVVATRADAGRWDLWEVAVDPTQERTVTVSLAAGPACDAWNAMCTTDGRKVLAASATVPHDRALNGVELDCPASHAGEGDDFQLTVGISSPLDPSKADVAANLTVTGASVGDGTWVDRLDTWSATLTASGDDAVRVVLWSSPPCSQAGAMCTDGDEPTGFAECTVPGPATPFRPGARFVGVPGMHDGDGDVLLFGLETEFPLSETSAANVAAAVDATNAAAVSVRLPSDGRLDRWHVAVDPSLDERPVRVTMAASPPCGEPGAMCTADGRRVVPAPPVTVPFGDLVDVDISCPNGHDGKRSFNIGISLDEELEASTADLAANLTVVGATVSAAGWDDDGYEDWSATLTPTTESQIEVVLARGPACGADGAMCTSEGRVVDEGACLVTGPDTPLTGAFTNVPGGHSGTGDVFDMRLKFSHPLNGTSAARVPDAVTVTNAESVDFTQAPDRSDLWTVRVRPHNDDVTASLAASGACGAAGSLCTADERRLSNAPSATVPFGDLLTTSVNCSGTTGSAVPTVETGETFEVDISIQGGLDPSTADVEGNLSVSGGTVASVTRDDDSYRTWTARVEMTSRIEAVVTLARSPRCSEPGAMCSAGGAIAGGGSCRVNGPDRPVGRWTYGPARHSGPGDSFSADLEVSNPLSAASAENMPDAVSSSGADLTVTRAAGRYDRWTVVAEVTRAGHLSIDADFSPPCGEPGALCSADGVPWWPPGSLPVASGDMVDTTLDCPADHDGDGEAFDVTIEFGSALDASIADVAGNLAASGATVGTVAVDADYEGATARITPTGDGEVTVTLRRSTFCTETGAMCTAGDGDPVAGGTCTVPRAREGRGVDGVSATFRDVPAAHDGASAFTVRIGLSAALDKATAAVADAVTATNGTVGAVSRVNGRYDLWQASVTPSGDDAVTVALAASPPCEEKGAMCTKDGRRVEAARTTVPGPPEGPEPAFSAADARAAEGAGQLSFAVTLDPAAADEARVDYATSDGTATAGEDYAAASGTLTFAAGDTSKTVAVTVTDDAADELGETLALTLSNASGAAIADATATGTIEDDDRPLVSVSDAGGPEGGSAAFEVTLDVAPAAEVSAYYTTVDGTATAGADYTGRWGTLRFAAGETAKTVAVDLLEDEEEEPDETFRLELTWASGVGLADPTGIGTIEGDEGTEDLTASFAPVPDGHDGTAFTVGLEFSEEIDDLGFAWVRDTFVAATGGTVERASRRNAPANLAWNIEVEPASPGGDVTLSMASGETAPDGRAVVPGDPATVPGQSLSVADASAAEGGTASFAVTLDRGATGTVTVDYSTADGTATAGADYAAASGTLTFEAGESSKTVAVAVLADPEAESEETFALTLSNASGAGLADASATGTIEASAAAPALTASFAPVPGGHNGTAFSVGLEFSEEIDDLGFAWVRDTFVAATGGTVERALRRNAPANLAWNIEVGPASPGGDVTLSMASGETAPDGRAVVPGDPATVPGQSLSVADASAAEGGTASFAVTLDRGATGTVTVDYATADGTATAGADYAAASGTLTFEAGESAKTVAVATLADTDAEFDETFALTLSNAAGAALADAAATGTVADDDSPSARLHDVPAEHGGKDQAFEAGLEFSEEIADIGHAWVRDSLATATNGTVERARRVVGNPPENRAWTLTVEPDSSADVVLGLAAGLLVPDGRPLRVGGSATVRGPAPTGSSVNGAELTLVWPSARDGFGTPSGSDYAVAVNGAPRAVASAEIAGRRAVLVLSAPVAAADAVAVGYVGSAMHPLADASGSVRSAPWGGVAADNATGKAADGPQAADAAAPPAPQPAATRLAAAPADAVRLDASGLGLADLSALAAFAALERLDLSDNALADLRGIGAHGALRELDLSGNRIADVAPLRALVALERLDLSGNRVTDVAPLAGLPALAVLVLDGNAVADLGALTHLAALEHLSLADNAVPDVTPLQDLPRLRRLDLGGNPVADLSPLGDVGSLEWLALPGEPAAAADALVRLTGLRWVWPERRTAPAR